MTHVIDRTSPLGQAFLGTCRLCGMPNLKNTDVFKECQNPRGVSSDEALLDAIINESPALQRSPANGE